MKNPMIVSNETITTGEEMFAALRAVGLPTSVCNAVDLLYDVCSIRKYVESDDINEFKSMIHNVGNARAAKIIQALKGKIPGVMSRPCPDRRKADIEMHNVPNMNLVYVDDAAKLTKFKVNEAGEFIKDKSGEMIVDTAKKRFGYALQVVQQLTGQKESIAFTTTSPVQDDYQNPAKAYRMEKYWRLLCENGMKIHGKRYVPAIMGTNAKMKCVIHWIEDKYVEPMKKILACGADLSGEQKIAKLEAYFGLLLPYTHQLLGGVLTPKMEVITDEWVNEHIGKNVFFSPDGTMTEKDTFNVAEFDGMAIINFTEKLIKKMNLKRHELRQLRRELAKFNGGTLRGPWHKGIIVVGFDIHQCLHDMGVHTIDGRDIDDIAIFADASAFKASIGEGKMYKTFDDFANAFIDNQHRFGVLLENHGLKSTFLPAQQLQAAHGADRQFIEEGAKAEVEYLNAALDPKVAADRYAPRVIARIAQRSPEIMNVWFATEFANNGYVKERNAAMSGRTHGNSKSGFGIKDLIAYCQWIAYKEGVRKELPTGALKAYQVYAPTAEFTGSAVASRNPVIANYGQKVVDVVDDLGEYAKYFDEGFDYIMVSIHDDLCKLLRMDHDGDKIRLTNAKWYCDAVNSIPTNGVFAEWDSFGEVAKVVPTRANEVEFFCQCTSTPTLGLNVDNCGKMITNGIITSHEREMLMDYMMNKGTDVKQGADGSNVGGAAGVIWNAMNKELNANKGEKNKYSLAQAHGKGLKGRLISSDKVADAYGNSNLDIIGEAADKKTSETLAFTGNFDIERVLFDQMKNIVGLAGGGTKEMNFTNPGKFNALVQRNAKEWDKIDEDVRKSGWAEHQAWKKEEARKEMLEYAQAINPNFSLKDVYDAITTYVFVTLRKSWMSRNDKIAKAKAKLAERWDTEVYAEIQSLEASKRWMAVLAKTYIEWFGDMLEEAYLAKENLDVLPAVSEGVEIDEDPFM